jgi:hypothetical protein
MPRWYEVLKHEGGPTALEPLCLYLVLLPPCELGLWWAHDWSDPSPVAYRLITELSLRQPNHGTG